MRVLLIAGSFHWSEGAIAKGIVQALPNFYFYFFSIHEFKFRKNELDELIKSVDIVHWLFNVSNLSESQMDYYLNIKVPQIATVHHVCPQEFSKIEYASKSNLIHTVSNEWYEYVGRNTNVEVRLASLGVNHLDFKRIPNLKYNKKYPLKIGMMGNYPGKFNRKRIDIALNILKRLKEDEISFELFLQGSGWEKYYSEFVELGIIFKHKKFSSSIESRSFFSNINIYLCTSDYEGGPLPVLESLASGVPVISSKVGIANDALRNGGGVLCSTEDVATFYDAFIEIINDKEFYNNLVDTTKQIIKEFYWINLDAQYRSMYLDAIKNWELQNSKKYILNQEKIQSSKKQRKKELLYDQLREATLIAKHDKTQAIKSVLPILFGFSIPVVHRIRMMSRILKK